VVTNKDCNTSASELLIKNTTTYTVEHNFFWTARWWNSFF